MYLIFGDCFAFGGFPQIRGTIWEGPCNKDCNILGLNWGPVIFGNYHLRSRVCILWFDFLAKHRTVFCNQASRAQSDSTA